MLDKLVSKAVELGGKKAVIIPANTIVVSRWVQLKCQYGCPEYGKRLTCPPHSPSYERMKEILKEKHGVICASPKGCLQDAFAQNIIIHFFSQQEIRFHAYSSFTPKVY